MREFIRKLKTIPAGEIERFLLVKNHFQVTECIEQKSDGKYVAIDLPSISSSFTGIIKATKPNSVDDIYISDSYAVHFEYTDGHVSYISIKRTLIKSTGDYIFLYYKIDDSEEVHTSEAVLKHGIEFSHLIVNHCLPDGTVLKHQVILEVDNTIHCTMQSFDPNSTLIDEVMYSFINNENWKATKVPTSMEQFQSHQATIKTLLTGIKDSLYGFNCDDILRSNLEKAIKYTDIFSARLWKMLEEK